MNHRTQSDELFELPQVSEETTTNSVVPELKLEPTISVKFHRNKAEVKKRVSVDLAPGTYKLVFDDLCPDIQKKSFRFIVLEGSSGVISTQILVDQEQVTTSASSEQTTVSHLSSWINEDAESKALSIAIEKLDEASIKRLAYFMNG